MAEFIKKLYRNQGIRYIFFGGCTTFVNLGSYALLRTVLGVDMTLANVLAIFLSILFAYAVNKQFVFESRTHGVRRTGRGNAAVLSECVSPRCLSKCSALFF